MQEPIQVNNLRWALALCFNPDAAHARCPELQEAAESASGAPQDQCAGAHNTLGDRAQRQQHLRDTHCSLATDRRGAGDKICLGYQLNRYVGFELGCFNLGTLPLTTNLSALGRVGTAPPRLTTARATAAPTSP